MKSINSLWGSILTRFDFDPVSHSLNLGIQVNDDAQITTHQMRCTEVRELRFFNEIQSDWTYAEITEVEADYDNISSFWNIEFILWSEKSGLVIRCGDIFIDDVPLTR